MGGGGGVGGWGGGENNLSSEGTAYLFVSFKNSTLVLYKTTIRVQSFLNFTFS